MANAQKMNSPHDQTPAPRLEPLVGEDTDEVQHDDQQRELEADTEHQQQVDQKAEVLVTGQRRHLHIAADGEQELEGLRQHHVGEDGARDEQRRAQPYEHHGEAAFLVVEPGGVMNAHSWYSHTGQASTMPAVRATFSRNMNWSNGAVASSRH